MATMIDTLEFAERFEEAGFEHKQARALANALSLAHDTGRQDLVTKPYFDLKLAAQEARTDTRMAEMEARIIKAIADQGEGIRKDMGAMDVRLTKQIGDSSNNVQTRLWAAVVVVGGLAAAIVTAANLLLK